MRVISFLNQKGGVGKTTLAVNVAGEFARVGHRVLLIDADPQASAQSWVAARSGSQLFDCVGITDADIHKKVREREESYDFIIIDSPPSTKEIARSVIIASDIILIPVQPNPLDIWAAEKPRDLIEEASRLDRSRDVALIINRKQPNTALGKQARENLEHLGIHSLQTEIHQRIAFAESTASGLIVSELDPTGKAAQEIQALTQELEVNHV